MNLLGQADLAIDYSGLDGFLGFRGSLMLDVVFLAMFAVLPVLAVSIYLAKQGRYQVHKRLQLLLGAILLLTVVAFEVDMRWNGWQPRALASPYFRSLPNGEMDWSCPVGVSLIIHLFFAIPTALLWTCVIVAALRKFPRPPAPGKHSAAHRFWGWLAALEMTGTALTGWVFYYLAFVAV